MLKRLNSREQIIVIGGLIVLLLMIFWFAMLSPYVETMQTLDRKIITHKRNLNDAQQMQEQIALLQKQLATVGNRRSGGKPLFAKVEALTEQTGVREQLLAMRPQPSTTQGEFRQQLVEIRLEKMSLPQLVKLLHAVEYRSGGVQVKSMRIKPRFDNRSNLDVSLILMSLEKP